MESRKNGAGIKAVRRRPRLPWGQQRRVVKSLNRSQLLIRPVNVLEVLVLLEVHPDPLGGGQALARAELVAKYRRMVPPIEHLDERYSREVGTLIHRMHRLPLRMDPLILETRW